MKTRTKKPISPLKRFLKDAWEAFVENARWHKAMKNLTKLEWSTDYMIYLLKKADNDAVQIRVENNGLVLTLSKVQNLTTSYRDPTSQEAFQKYMGFSE